MTVGLVIVSHSAKLAEGVVELAAQMAPDVVLAPAGGTGPGPDGTAGIGTSLEKIQDALASADSGDGVVVLADLGSAVMTAETALEFAPEPERLLLADAPLVEGAVAAAVAAQTGATLQAVRDAAEAALARTAAAAGEPAAAQPYAAPQPYGAGAPAATGSFTLINDLGLHARPAAVLAKNLTPLDAEVTINGVDGKSVMLLMTLIAGKGSTLEVSATGPQRRLAVDLIRREVEAGFGEL
ncbi:PTS-dependent dihydroxyacetone kinase phosphotransferase subunit DhaM [Paenarthrobacter sp. DKR-5]|uniref:dihydroxyacetone kinase phosphoryl donor subunit DhaM n=1 Tax=Paenarthrobacter sp. DKR-5 TaxID=2835535 RepID=UPI001BDC1825|nr:dihydroxyacetone kinase phosphoryl donor subunit DhaM [Paenarthrobacter sp. DKR-5]MBT1003291.1 PTS-dependent dihydroxyacetone kinase phosphotransferase subunit DhaM [Paenarthrobacter sp. DKR-5]